MTATADRQSIVLNKKFEGILEIEVEGTKAHVFSNHLNDVQIEFHPYGYEAIVNCTTYDDEKVTPLFAQDKVMKASLSFTSTHILNAGTPLFKLQGIVTERYYQSKGSVGLDGFMRVYTLRFKDPAQASWGHHFPIKLFVDKTMKDVIDAEKNPLITIAYDWDVLTQVHPVLAFSLEFRRGLPPNQQVSFYSFLTWYLHQFNGILDYDYEKNNYTIRGKKKEGGSPLVIPDSNSTPPQCQFPEPLRSLDRTIKHSAESQEPTDVENLNGFQAVRKDALDDTEYVHFPDQITQKVKSKMVREKPLIRFHLTELEKLGLEKFLPGKLVEFQKKSALESWVDDPLFKGKPYRVVNISLRLVITTEQLEVERKDQEFDMTVAFDAEDKEETYVERPAFQSPSYPFFLPGKIFCDKKEAEQTTFTLIKHEKIPLGHYQVLVPLVEDKKKVIVPFMPDIISGQHYFPLCKDQQVMLAVYFQTAKIERALDWQPLTRLPLDTQANQVVFGSNGKDKYVVQRHEFKDGKNSVLIIKQSSSPDQTQTVQIQEKELTITVEEKGKSTVLIKLHRDTGLLLQLKDDASGVTQQTEYTTASITHLSKGKPGESIIVQTPEAISLKAKACNIECDDMIVDAKKTITQKAANKVFIEAPAVNIKDKVKMG